MHFAINEQIGNSEHLTLEMLSDDKIFGRVKVTQDIAMSFGKLLKDCEKIKGEFLECLEKEDKVEAIVELVRKIMKEYMPRLKKKKSVTIWQSKIEEFEK